MVAGINKPFTQTPIVTFSRIENNYIGAALHENISPTGSGLPARTVSAVGPEPTRWKVLVRTSAQVTKVQWSLLDRIPVER